MRLVSASLVASAAKNVLVPMHRNVVMVRDDPSAATNLNKNAYYREYDANKADVGLIKLHYKSAATIPEEAGRHYHTLSLAHHPSNRCPTVIHTGLHGGQEAATPGQEGQDPAAVTMIGRFLFMELYLGDEYLTARFCFVFAPRFRR